MRTTSSRRPRTGFDGRGRVMWCVLSPPYARRLPGLRPVLLCPSAATGFNQSAVRVGFHSNAGSGETLPPPQSPSPSVGNIGR